MNATRIPAAAMMVVASLATAFAAGEPPPGASSCSGCHATKAGIDTPVPQLNGRKAAETAAIMQQFRAGQRPSTIMDRIAKGFSEAEMQAIAEWYEKQQ